MAYLLTVNRVMGLCAFEVNGRTPRSEASQKKIVKQFNKQLEGITEKYLAGIFGTIEKKIKALDLKLSEESSDDIEMDLSIFQDKGSGEKINSLFNEYESVADETTGLPARDPIIGRFRARRYKLQAGEMIWDLRIRPSVTACVLEQEDRISKLWWTFEGVPANATRPPSEEDSLSFVKFTTALAEEALPMLRNAYALGLDEVTWGERGPQRLTEAQLRVTLADNTDSDFSKLAYEMYFAGVPFESALDGTQGPEIQEGARKVLNFVEHASGRDSGAIRVSTDGADLSAVYSGPITENNSSDGIQRYVISGLASSVNLLPRNLHTDKDWIDRTNLPDMLRSISAARPLSALIADKGARELDSIARSEPTIA